jgi:hypothetical protein
MQQHREIDGEVHLYLYREVEVQESYTPICTFLSFLVT